MFFSPIPDHLSHQNTLNHVGVWKKKIGHGRNESSRVLHSFRVLSQEPDNIVEPSGEKQQHITCVT